jgi:hypothetical protein
MTFRTLGMAAEYSAPGRSSVQSRDIFYKVSRDWPAQRQGWDYADLGTSIESEPTTTQSRLACYATRSCLSTECE